LRGKPPGPGDCTRPIRDRLRRPGRHGLCRAERAGRSDRAAARVGRRTRRARRAARRARYCRAGRRHHPRRHGLVLAHQVAGIAPGALSLNWRTVAIVLAAIALYLAWKYARSRRQVRRAWGDRITPESLRHRQLAGEPVAVVDLRHELDFEAEPDTIPGAIYIPAEQIAERHREIPRGVEVVLYCTCPDQATSARAAARLRRRGVTRVRPLEGGFDAWQARNYPIEFRGPAVEDDARILNAA
jgi:rhodanese-related sulfurtransferase